MRSIGKGFVFGLLVCVLTLSFAGCDKLAGGGFGATTRSDSQDKEVVATDEEGAQTIENDQAQGLLKVLAEAFVNDRKWLDPTKLTETKEKISKSISRTDNSSNSASSFKQADSDDSQYIFDYKISNAQTFDDCVHLILSIKRAAPIKLSPSFEYLIAKTINLISSGNAQYPPYFQEHDHTYQYDCWDLNFTVGAQKNVLCVQPFIFLFEREFKDPEEKIILQKMFDKLKHVEIQKRISLIFESEALIDFYQRLMGADKTLCNSDDIKAYQKKLESLRARERKMSITDLYSQGIYNVVTEKVNASYDLPSMLYILEKEKYGIRQPSVVFRGEVTSWTSWEVILNQKPKSQQAMIKAIENKIIKNASGKDWVTIHNSLQGADVLLRKLPSQK